MFSSPVAGGAGTLVSSTAAGNPRSAYNAATSATGRFVAFEIAAGNLNFAKRYGQIHVNLHDAATGKTEAIDGPVVKPGYSRSAFNPSLSDDGRELAFSAVGVHGNTVIWVRHADTKATGIVTPRPQGAPPGDAYGGCLSGDGRRLVFTWVPRDGSRSHVYRTNLTTGEATLVDRADGANGAVANGPSSQPASSTDGRFVAFSSSARNLGAGSRGVRVYVRDIQTGATTTISNAADGSGFEPAISADGARVAYTSARGGRSRVVLFDGATGQTTAVTDGRGISFDPSLSGDGTRIAFASNRRDLASTRSTGARSVYVRDVRTGRTALISGGPAAK